MASILITGAAGGIGSALARKLAHESSHLILIDRDNDKLSRLKDELQSRHKIEVTLGSFDYTDNQQLDAFVSQIQNLDGLINNAGIAFTGKFESFSEDQIRQTLRVNLEAPLILTRKVLPLLNKSSAPFIVNVSSGAGLVGVGGIAPYCASKFGLVGFSEALRAELGKKIPVLLVCPSFVSTGLIDNSLGSASNKTQQDTLTQAFLSAKGRNPDEAAEEIILGIKRKDELLLLHPEVGMLHILKRLFPGVSGFMVRMIFKQFEKKGYL